MNEFDALQSTYARAQQLVDGLEPIDMPGPPRAVNGNVRALLVHS